MNFCSTNWPQQTHHEGETTTVEMSVDKMTVDDVSLDEMTACYKNRERHF